MTASPSRQEVAAATLMSVGRFRRRLRQAPVQDDLSASQISALTQLDRVGRASAVELARVEQITPQGMGAILAALQDADLVQRHPDPSDGRRVVMSVTPAGEEIVRHKTGARIEQLASALSAFSEEERAALLFGMRLLDRLGESI